MPRPRKSSDATTVVSSYSDFRALLDDPAEVPGLRFDEYAAALAEMIARSRAAFSVGILGGWGSGKTTLMQAIRKILNADDGVVTVWFTAWRYEKEQHLIVPLLDVLREALAERADKPGKPPWARAAAAGIARAGEVLLAGLSVAAALPGAQVTVSPGDMINAIKARADGQESSLSYYHASFRMLGDAIRGLSANGKRLVVFVDDLDRCLPTNAIVVLESMKLFFDVEGCVFVAGLDQEIVERAVAEKFSTGDNVGPSAKLAGADYLQKLFQIQFSLPLVSANDLPGYLTTITRNGDLGVAQLADFERHIRPHFRFLEGEGWINPREIKRLINTYTFQLKMLSLRLGNKLDPHVVLALVCMNFRPDWNNIYVRLAAEPQLFQLAMSQELANVQWPTSVYLSGERLSLPHTLIEYLHGEGAPLLTDRNLPLYVSAAESTWSTDPSVLDARTSVGRLRQLVAQLSSGDLDPKDGQRQITSELERLFRLVSSRRDLLGRPGVLREQIQAAVSELGGLAQELVDATADESAGREPFVGDWVAKTVGPLAALDADLKEMHNYVRVSASR